MNNTQSTQNVSGYKGSPMTFALVRKAIEERYGIESANLYSPETNCFTFKRWLERGFKVKPGEKSIKSYTIIEDKRTGKKYLKSVHLFFALQVEPLTKK